MPPTRRSSLEPMLEFGFWGWIGKYLFVSLLLIHDSSPGVDEVVEWLPGAGRSSS